MSIHSFQFVSLYENLNDCQRAVLSLYFLPGVLDLMHCEEEKHSKCCNLLFQQIPGMGKLITLRNCKFNVRCCQYIHTGEIQTIQYVWNHKCISIYLCHPNRLKIVCNDFEYILWEWWYIIWTKTMVCMHCDFKSDRIIKATCYGNIKAFNFLNLNWCRSVLTQLKENHNFFL